MPSVNNAISPEEQRLFVLLFIYHYERIEKKIVSRKVLLTNAPDMTKGPPRSIPEQYMDQILGELAESGYIEVKLCNEESLYQVSDSGKEFLERDDLLVSSDGEPVLTRYLPREELQTLIDGLAEALNAQIGIMNENGQFWTGSQPVRGICDPCIRNVSFISCMCCDLLAALRAREINVHSFHCHAGFIQCIARIDLNEGEHGCGYVFVGRIVPENIDIDKFAQYCKARGELDLSEKGIRSLVEEHIEEEKRRPEIGIEVIERITSGIAILLSELVRKLGDYATKIDALNEAIKTGVGVLPLDDIPSKIMESAAKVFRYDGAAMWELSPDQRKLSGIASKSGLPDFAKDSEFDIDGDGFVSWIAKNEKPLLIGDVFAHIEEGRIPKPRHVDYIVDRKLGSFLGVPIIFENRLVGVFEIEKHSKGQFTKLDQDLLMAIARIAGIAKSPLMEILTNISQSENLRDLLDTAVEEMPLLLDAEYCSILLFDPERERVFLRASNSPALRDKINEAYYDKEKKGLTWHIAQTGESVMMPDARESPYWKGQYWEAGSHNYLGCALKDNSGQVHGVIRFIGRRGGFSFIEADKRLAETLSDWLSLAIDRVQLASAREHSELLLKIAEIQNTSSSIEDLLNRIADEMIRTFDCRACEIALVADRESVKLEIRGVDGEHRTEREGEFYAMDDDSFTAAVALKREIIRLHDIKEFYGDRSVPEKSFGLGARLGIPLMRNQQLTGILKLANKNVTADNPSGQFTREDEITGSTIAAAIAKTAEEYQERENLSALLRGMDRQYMEERNAWFVLKCVVENLDRAIAGTWGSLYRHDAGEDVFVRVAYSAREGGAAPPEKTGAGHIPMVVGTRQSLYVKDALNGEEHQSLLQSESSDDVKKYIKAIGSEYAVPLVVMDRIYAILCLYKTGIDSFTIADRQAADNLVARASLLLESHELFEALKKLYEASLRLQTRLRPDELLRAIVENVVEIGYDRARLYLVSSDEKRTESAVQVGLKDLENIRRFENHEIVGELREDPSGMREGIVDDVLVDRKPVIYVRADTETQQTIEQSRDTEGIRIYTSSTDLHKKELEREGVDEWLDFPLIAAGRKLGKVTVDNKWSKKPFSRIDCEILGLFGQYSAQAILNAREIERTIGFGFGARTLAHNIKNRAAAIGMTLDLVQRQMPPNEKLARRIGTMQRANDGILRHVNAMRKVADLEETELEPITIGELTEALQAELGDALGESKIVFGFDVSKSILKERVEVDRDQMIEVFLNILRNSQEAMKGEGGIALSVWLESDHIYVSWQDDGPGISEQDVEHLFEMGFTTKAGGTGTGLYSAKRMLLMNRGDVWFDKSKKNDSGNFVARFVMKIPLLSGVAEGHARDSFDREGQDHDVS